MSNEQDSGEIPVEIEQGSAEAQVKNEQDNSNEEKTSEDTTSKLTALLEEEKSKAKEFEEKYKRALADFQNLERKSLLDIQNGVNFGIDKFMLEFLTIYDDFIRAKEVFANSNVDIKGLESILKNMDALLKKFNVVPIKALGEIFDPKIHEAIATKIDPELDEGTITQEIRKGYISHDRAIRPTLVEISKKS